MKTPSALAALFLLALASHAAADRAASPADATVFIRVGVTLHLEIDDGPGLSRRVDKEIDRLSGSGFVISPFGHVLTNHHVVSPLFEQFLLEQSGVKAIGTLSVSGIDVCFPRESAVWEALVAQPGPDEAKCLGASVLAQDASLDLAVLSVSAPHLPYLALGDSDAAVVGEATEALGFPLGRLLEIAKGPTSPDAVPALTRMPGTISALRMGCAIGARSGSCTTPSDRDRERRFFQISNGVNPGNSGGPVVDRNGFAVGVVQSKITDSGGKPVEGIAFAIPINIVKEFLEDQGLDAALPVRRLRPGPLLSLDPKRLRLAVPEGFTDVASLLTRVENDAQQSNFSLRIDRVLSPWTAQGLEEQLTRTATFEQASWQSHESRMIARPGGPSLRVGRATGDPAANGGGAWMLYAILDLGAEKLVARFVGTAERLAFNESVLTASLASLDGQRLSVPNPAAPGNLAWSASVDADGQQVVPIPIGWSIMADGPSTCAGLTRPRVAGAASAGDDFSVALRAAAWVETDLIPAVAASACSSTRGSQPGASYTLRLTWLGVEYVVDGVFFRQSAGRLVQLEVLAPEGRAEYARALLTSWVKRVAQ